MTVERALHHTLRVALQPVSWGLARAVRGSAGSPARDSPAPRQEHHIPPSILSLTTLTPLDYVDLFTTSALAPQAASAEQWARTAIEGAPAVGRFIAWRALLGFRLEKEPAPGFIGGWRIDDREESWIRIETSSRIMTAQIVFLLDDERVWFATFIRFDQPMANLLWTPVSAIHRSVAPDFLRGAVLREERRLARLPAA